MNPKKLLIFAILVLKNSNFVGLKLRPCASHYAGDKFRKVWAILKNSHVVRETDNPETQAEVMGWVGGAEESHPIRLEGQTRLSPESDSSSEFRWVIVHFKWLVCGLLFIFYYLQKVASFATYKITMMLILCIYFLFI